MRIIVLEFMGFVGSVELMEFVGFVGLARFL